MQLLFLPFCSASPLYLLVIKKDKENARLSKYLQLIQDKQYNEIFRYRYRITFKAMTHLNIKILLLDLQKLRGCSNVEDELNAMEVRSVSFLSL